MQALLDLQAGFEAKALLPPSSESFTEKFWGKSLSEKIEEVVLSWTEEVSRLHYEANLNRGKVQSLKAITIKLIQNDSVGLLSEGLSKQHLLTEKLKKRIQWLSREIFSAHVSSESPLCLNPGLRFFSLGQSSLPGLNVEDKEKMMLRERDYFRLRRLSKTYDKESREVIIQTFERSTSPEGRQSLLKRFSYEELIPILQALYPTWSSDQLISYIVSLDLRILQGVILSLDDGLIPGLRSKLMEASSESKVSFQSKCESLLYDLSKVCNEDLKSEVGHLADILRQTETHKIDLYMLKEIDELSRKIQLQQTIFEKLERIMRPFKWKKVVRSTFQDLMQSYNRTLMRLFKLGTTLPDSLFKIIYDKAFDDYEDNDDAAEMILENWNFTSTKELIEIGILQESDELSWDAGNRKLKSLGLNKVADLKVLGIFNKITLKNYIERLKPVPLENSAAAAAASGV